MRTERPFAAGGKLYYDLAVMNHRQLDPESMVKFIEKSNDLLYRVTRTAEEKE